jgi:CheY-like chemotaxis protein
VREGVMVADDDPHMRRLLLATLRQFAFVPIDAANAQGGHGRGADAARIDLVIADLVLPEMSDAETGRRHFEQPQLKAVCLRVNASALLDAPAPTRPLSLNGLCETLASLHHADVTGQCDLRRWYSMAIGGVSDDLRAQAWDLFTRLTPIDAEMNHMNSAILIFAELPHGGALDQKGCDPTVENPRNRKLTGTWQFARLRQPPWPSA